MMSLVIHKYNKNRGYYISVYTYCLCSLKQKKNKKIPITDIVCTVRFLLWFYFQMVDLETMYSLLSEKHSELLRAYNCMQVQQLKDSTLRKDKREIQRLSKINCDLLTDVNKLQTQLKETTEHNELLEFRLLELEDIETTTKVRLVN